MRYILAVCLLLVLPSYAYAQESTTEDVVLDKHIRIAPGVQGGDCFDVAGPRVLTINASAAEGRTGETARLVFYQDNTDPPAAYLESVLSPDTLTSRHAARAGRYCYEIHVSHRFASSLPTDAPERPYTVVDLKIVSTPYIP
jgi:hypothetical protein